MSRATKTKPESVAVLYNSAESTTRIRQVLRATEPPVRRVVLAAYLGRDADAFLPNPRGLTIVCNLTPGATDSRAISRLEELGATVKKSDRLHMKVYWSERGGCVISSANASRNAMGRSPLKEASVWLPPGMVDIDRLIREAKPEQISDSDLRKLEVATGRINASRQVPRAPGKPTSFLDWDSNRGKLHWKLAWWNNQEVSPCRAATRAAQQIFGIETPDNFVDVEHNSVSADDWILMFDSKTGGSLEWLRVDFVAKLERDEVGDAGYTYQAIQVRGPEFHEPPFSLRAGGFATAFRKIMKARSRKRIEAVQTSLPSDDLLRQLRKEVGKR